MLAYYCLFLKVHLLVYGRASSHPSVTWGGENSLAARNAYLNIPILHLGSNSEVCIFCCTCGLYVYFNVFTNRHLPPLKVREGQATNDV